MSSPLSEEKLLESIAANVVRLRTAKGLTQEAFAEAASLAPRYFQRIERGEVNLSVVVLMRLVEALGVPVARLLREAELPKARAGRPPKPRKTDSQA